MRRARLLTALLAVWLGLLVVVAPAQAQVAANGTPETALPLSLENAGVLPGDPAGRFAYYSFDYPGGELPAVFQLTVAPATALDLEGVALNIYGPVDGHLLAEGARTDATPTLTADLAARDAGVYLVQVANYTRRAISFELTAQGVPTLDPSDLAPTSDPFAPGAEPITPIPLTSPLTGTLAGDSGGAYVFYTFHHAGGAPAQVTLESIGPAVLAQRGIGFNVYHQTDSGKVVAAGIVNSDGTIERARLVSTEPGDYLIQVYNHVPHLTLSYRLSASAPAGR